MVTARLRAAYFIAANTALLIWVLQAGACAGLGVYDLVVPALRRAPMSPEVEQNYAHMPRPDRDALLAATRAARFRYEPVMGMTTQAITSRFVNVDAHGIRANGPERRDLSALDGAVWFLGGSTSFGDGIADHETIPAQLERVLAKPVINLAVSGYSSAEENLLLNQYLRSGYRPSLVVFLDGINEACQDGPYDSAMTELFERSQRGYNWDLGGPLVHGYWRAARRVRTLMRPAARESAIPSLGCLRKGRRFPLAEWHARLMAERGATCGLYRVDCRTLVQPFAGVHGRRDALPPWFLETDAPYLGELFRHLEPGWRAAGAIFVTDALDGYGRHPFIDEVHYSADASRVIAAAIAARLTDAGGNSQ